MKNTKTNRVEFREPIIIMRNAQLKVSEAGRQRVLREKRKNVHAGVVGSVITRRDLPPDSKWTHARYNPYLMEKFQIEGKNITEADYIILNHKGLWILSSEGLTLEQIMS